MTDRIITGYDEDPLNMTRTVYLSDGRAFKFDTFKRPRGDIESWLESMDLVGAKGAPVDVIQDGRKVGELPAFWSPLVAVSRSFLYDYRPGDLTLIDGKWHAHHSLGAGDLDMIVGFVRKDARGNEARQGGDIGSVHESPVPEGNAPVSGSPEAEALRNRGEGE